MAPKISSDNLATLREEVELLELQVRKLQAREFLGKHKASRKAKAEGKKEN